MPTERAMVFGGMDVVAAEHQGFHPEGVQLADRFATGFSHRVGHRENAQDFVLVDQQHHRLALALQGKQLRLDGFRAKTQLLDQPVVAQLVQMIVDTATHATAQNGSQIGHRV